MNEAAIAGAASLLAGMFTTRYSDYAYWSGWVRATAAGALALAIVYFLAGLLGWIGIDGALQAQRGGVVAAIAQGLIGHAALRTQLGRMGPNEVKGGRNLLSIVSGWILDALDSRATSGVKRWVRGLADERLVEVTFDLFWQHLEIPDEPLRARLHDLLKDAAEDLEGATEPARADGRGRLRGFCIKEIENNHVPKRDLT